MAKHQVISPVADVYGVPDKEAFRGKFETQLVLGEIFNVEQKIDDGWYKGTCAHDGYAGYIKSKHLTKSVMPATHIVTAARTHLYHDETIKSPMVDTISFGSMITVTGTHDSFSRVNRSGWVYQKHITPITELDKDHVAAAKKFLETPYYWGGRSGFGIDCSGLVQVCLARAGIPVERDTEMQESMAGSATETACTGDLVYFPGHVGIMVDDHHLIHANAFHMKVMIEPLRVIVERGKEITSIRRL